MTAHPDADPLLALAERVESGEAGREIDAEIAEATNFKTAPATYLNHSGRIVNAALVPAYTTSLDAIASLQEAVLPGWIIMTSEGIGRRWACILNGGPDDDYASAHATTEPAARLAALLRAVAMERRTLQGDADDHR